MLGRNMLRAIRQWNRRRVYRVGRIISRFLVPDVRRDVEIIDTARIDEGVITVRSRTWNVLYVARGMTDKPEFGEVREVEVSKLWSWPGNSWGGPVPTDADEAT